MTGYASWASAMTEALFMARLSGLRYSVRQDPASRRWYAEPRTHPTR